MDGSSYTEKCISLLSSNQFKHIYWNQKYNGHFQKLGRNSLNKSTRKCIQQDPAQVNFMELPRYTNYQ